MSDLNQSTFEHIFVQHAPSLRLGSLRKCPVIVGFSAIPGSGKSTLTEVLTGHHGFTRLANKDVRASLRAASVDAWYLTAYTLGVLDKLAAENHPAIVFDRNIDQWYEPLRSWAKAAHYRLVVVRITIDPRLLKQRINTRQPADRDHTLEVVDFYQRQHDAIRPNLPAQLEFIDDFDVANAATAISDLVHHNGLITN